MEYIPSHYKQRINANIMFLSVEQSNHRQSRISPIIQYKSPKRQLQAFQIHGKHTRK